MLKKAKNQDYHQALYSGVGFSFIYGLIIVLQQSFVRASLHPLQLQFFGYAVASTIMLVYFYFFKRTVFQMSSVIGIVLAFLSGLCAQVMGDLFVAIGLKTSTSINWSIIYLLSGPMTFLMSVFFLKEQIKANKLLAILISFFGALLVVYQSGISLSIKIGDILFISSAVLFALSNIFGQKALEYLNLFQVILIQTVPPAFILGISILLFKVPLNMSYPNVSFMIFTGIQMVVGISLVNLTIQKGGASFFTIMLNLVPIFGLIFSILILHQYPTFVQIIGGILVIASIFLFEKNAKKNNKNK